MSCAQRKQSDDYDAEQVELKARDCTIGPDSSLRAMYVSDPPCKVLRLDTVFTSTTRGRFHGLSSENMTLRSKTEGLKLGDLWDGALSTSGVCFWEDDKGVTRPARLSNLKDLLENVNRSVTVEMPWSLELLDVVVPTAEEWAAVRQRDVLR